MATILSIESAVNGFSVAIHREGVLISFVQLLNERVASSQLTTSIKQVVEFSEVKFADLNAIAVSEGPGSYTGLRIGVSTAKGLCVALEIPLISINTLEIMCHGIDLPLKSNTLLCPLIDARRMEVYTAIFEGKSRMCLEKVSAKIVDEGTFGKLLSENEVLFFGNGANKLKALYAKAANAFFLQNEQGPSANNMGKLALDKYQDSNFAALVEFEPLYLKPYFATTPKNKLSLQ